MLGFDSLSLESCEDGVAAVVPSAVGVIMRSWDYRFRWQWHVVVSFTSVLLQLMSLVAEDYSFSDFPSLLLTHDV